VNLCLFIFFNSWQAITSRADRTSKFAGMIELHIIVSYSCCADIYNSWNVSGYDAKVSCHCGQKADRDARMYNFQLCICLSGTGCHQTPRRTDSSGLPVWMKHSAVCELGMLTHCDLSNVNNQWRPLQWSTDELFTIHHTLYTHINDLVMLSAWSLWCDLFCAY